MKLQLIFIFISTLVLVWAAPDPTLYEYYTSGGIHSGLSAASDQFALNGKHFTIYGGSFHYFRVVPEYWRPVLQRFKAAGLNAVQFYVAWNLHEDIPGKLDFETPILNLDKFLQEIKEADMFAIVRPGPYICAEWEFGGFPSWLLRDPHLRFRTNNKHYMERVKLYWDKVMSIVNKHQFTTTGGPVIALQIENEYSQYIHHPSSDEYLHFLQNATRESGFKELVFQSDPGSQAQHYPIKGMFSGDAVLQTTNLNSGALKQLTELKAHQPGKPAFVSEFWPGWFDRWNNTHHSRYTVEKFEHEVTDTMFTANASANFYMFIGGTNFGFMSGRRITTSYDYDAPLSESGNYTSKYHKTREIYQKLVASGRLPKTHLPDVPQVPHAHAYGKVAITESLSLESILGHAQKFHVDKPIPMEVLNVGKDYGQRNGFVLYRVEGKEAKTYEVTGPIKDRAILLVDSHEQAMIDNDPKTFHHTFTHAFESKAAHTYDLLVETMGRINGGAHMDQERRGIQEGEIHLDKQAVHNITIYSLDFPTTFIESLKTWSKFDPKHIQTAPTMYRTELKIDGAPADTFLRLPGWTKGQVFVNGFNLGRYWVIGPQQTLYIPAPLLKTGANHVVVFELHKAGHELEFGDHPILG